MVLDIFKTLVTYCQTAFQKCCFLERKFYRCLLQDRALDRDTEPIFGAFLLWEVQALSLLFASQLFSQAFLPLIIRKVAVEDQFGSKCTFTNCTVCYTFGSR